MRGKCKGRGKHCKKRGGNVKGKGKCGRNKEEVDPSKGCANTPLGFAIMVLLNILNCNNSGCRGYPKYTN